MTSGHFTFGLPNKKWALGLVLSSGWLSGCRPPDTPRLPPPAYEKPSLPYWEAPQDNEVAPFDLEGREGEAVKDDKEELEEASEPESAASLPEGKLSEVKPHSEAEIHSEARKNSE